MASEKKTMTWEQAHMDISMLGLWCDSCCAFFACMETIILCPTCGNKTRLRESLTADEVDKIVDAIQDCTHITGEKDGTCNAEEEMEAHRLLEHRLQEYDWWHGSRGQLQYIWYELRDQPWSIPGYYNCSRHYFAKAYAEIYQRKY